MPLRKTVAMERRVDLASLFCLIARHGPAVLMALLVIGCSLAGFIMLRNMRDRRRRRRAERRDSGGGRGEAEAAEAAEGVLGTGEREQEPCALKHSASTGPGDEEHVYRSYARHRRASSERIPYRDKLPDRHTAEDRDQLPDKDIVENRLPFSFFWHRSPTKAAESHVGESRYNHDRNFSQTSKEEVIEEVRDAEETGLTNVGYEEQEKAIEADSSEDITSTTEGFSDEEFAQEEETVQFPVDNQSCPTAATKLGANNDRDNTEETDTQQKPELETNIAPALKPEEISAGPVSSDQIHNPLEENLFLPCGEAVALPHSDSTQQALCMDSTASANTSAEVMKEDLVETTHDETCQSESVQLADTKDDCSLAPTNNGSVVAALSSNGKQQSEPQASQTLDTGINQSGLCPQELSCFETVVETFASIKDIELVSTKSPEATFDTNRAPNVEAVSDSDYVSVERNGIDKQELEPISTIFSPMIMKEDSVEPSHVETCESNSSVHVDTTNYCNVGATTEVTNLSSNSEQQSESLTPTSDNGINQNGLCAQEQSQVKVDADKSFDQKDTGLSNTESPKTTLDDGNAPAVEAVSDSPVVSVAEGSNVAQQETVKGEETETTSLEKTSTVLRLQSNEMLPDVQDDNKAFTENLSKPSDNILEEQPTLPFSEEKMNIFDQKEGQSLGDDFKHEECSVLPFAPREVMEDGTCLSGLASNDKEEISTVTVQTNDDKLLEGTPDLDTEITLPPTLPSQKSESESNQTDEHMATCNISATTRGKIESMVEQMVAKVYKDVTQSTLEVKVMQLEEKTSLEIVQNNDSIYSDNLACAQSVEKTVNSVPCLSNIKLEKTDGQTDCALVANDTSENKSPNANSNENINPPANEVRSNPKTADILQVESTSLKQTISLEQLDELLVQPTQDIGNGVSDHSTDEPVVKVIKEETYANNVCSNLAAPIQVGPTTVSCLEVASIEKDIQIGTEKIISTSFQSEQQRENESVVLLDIDNSLTNKTLEKEEGIQEISSSRNTQKIDFTETQNEVQSELKESGILLDIGNDVSNLTAKSSKVVIVCRTMESSICTAEISDEEEGELKSETSCSEITSKMDSWQGQIDSKECPHNEEPCANLMPCSGDALTAQTLIKEITTEEGQSTERGKTFDLTSHVALDIPQDCSTSMESAEQIELKDNRTSTPSLESGISSMTISPDEEESRNITIEEDVLTTSQFYAENKSGSVFTSGVINENAVIMENIEQISLQMSADKDLSDLSMTNEDSFGSEIEDDYHKAAEELMAQVVHNIKPAKSVELNEKDLACANKENGEKVDLERTEISIMEATMDHNEWITDGNYQMLPWMTAASISKESAKGMEAKDVPESKPQASSSEESVESAKKVLAVQPMPQNVDVTFRIHYVTLSPHQTVAVTGDQPELGAWKSVVPLAKSKDGYWTCVVSLPAESQVEWKFVVLENGEVCRWEECGNRQLYTGYGDDLLVHKWWGFL